MKYQNQFKNRLEITRIHFILAIQTWGCGGVFINVLSTGKKKKKPWCMMCAGFDGVNTLPWLILSFQRRSLTLDLEEMSTVGSHEW